MMSSSNGPHEIFENPAASAQKPADWQYNLRKGCDRYHAVKPRLKFRSINALVRLPIDEHTPSDGVDYPDLADTGPGVSREFGPNVIAERSVCYLDQQVYFVWPPVASEHRRIVKNHVWLRFAVTIE